MIYWICEGLLSISMELLFGETGQHVEVKLLHGLCRHFQHVVVVIFLALSPHPWLLAETFYGFSRRTDSHEYFHAIERFHAVSGVHPLVWGGAMMEISQNLLDLAFELSLLLMRIDIQQRHKQITLLHRPCNLNFHSFFILRSEVPVNQIVQLRTEISVNFNRISFLLLHQSFNRWHWYLPCHEVHTVQLLNQSILNLPRLNMHLLRERHRERLRRNAVQLQNEGFVVCFIWNAGITLHLDLVQKSGDVVRLTAHRKRQFDGLNSIDTHVRFGLKWHHGREERNLFS